MIPGEIFPAEGDIELNAGREGGGADGRQPGRTGRCRWAATNHFAETNAALDFDRDAGRGMRLDIAAGTAVRFEPGQTREVSLVPYGGDRAVWGFNKAVMGGAVTPRTGRGRQDGRRRRQRNRIERRERDMCGHCVMENVKERLLVAPEFLQGQRGGGGRPSRWARGASRPVLAQGARQVRRHDPRAVRGFSDLRRRARHRL